MTSLSNYRTISASFPAILSVTVRLLVVLLILGFASLVIFSNRSDDNSQDVLGSRETNADLVDAQGEISRLLSVIEQRPDYAAAWLRLSVLYDQLGENDLAQQARETARRLNPNL